MTRPFWSTLRAAAQLSVWLAFIALIVATRDPVESGGWYTVFPRLSAHLGIATSLAAGRLVDAFLPALAVLVPTLALGRFFCGWLCPLGASIDATGGIFNRARRNTAARAGSPRAIKPWKYGVLAVSLLLALGGIQLAGVIDPLSLAVRTYATALYPYFDHLAKAVLGGAADTPLLKHAAAPAYGALRGTLLDHNPLMFLNHAWILALFAAVLASSVFARRFWCQAICPLGALLALAGRFGILRRTVDAAACTRCRACERSCRMNAITDSGLGTDRAECVQCFECLKACPQGAIAFKASLRAGTETSPQAPSSRLTRRQAITIVGVSAIMVPAVRLNPALREEHSALIRPPGAHGEERFMELCIRCGECMKACPTNALHPVLFESGARGIFTPRLVPRIGWCEKDCVLCGEVCPTGAIRKLTRAGKERSVIGTAVIRRDLCIPWAEGRNCLVCEEVCPTSTKSIRFKEETAQSRTGERVTVKFPYVREDLCTGCGICENKCPVAGSAAIRVRVPKAPEGAVI
ncbi:MAG: 4Fe-4S dicluster domain-containing protein [Spirochaetes bacterium]|nr:MAG: 4Fe-4S dicluster domain-containing protein [Spirochaetota bacterium]